MKSALVYTAVGVLLGFGVDHSYLSAIGALIVGVVFIGALYAAQSLDAHSDS